MAELFNCTDVLTGEFPGGMDAHDLTLYDAPPTRSRPRLLAVKAGASGGSAQVHIGPAEARDLAKALAEWADSSEATS